jgi:hypothetical protein
MKRKLIKTQEQKLIEDCKEIIKMSKILDNSALKDFSDEIISKQQMKKVLLLSSKIKKWAKGIIKNNK